MKLQGTAVLIRPDDDHRETGANLKVKKQTKERWGTVVDVSPHCRAVKKGDKVFYNLKSASHIHVLVDGNEILHHFTTENDIFEIL